MKAKQLKIIEGKVLLITWDDGKENKITLEKLRKLCPCASCITEKLHESKSFILLFLGAQTKVEDLTIVGNYALQIKWKDGHSTGIYEYPYLLKIAEA